MIQVRKSEERGHAQHGWLESQHTFSFADYYNPEFSGFRSLLVINEDRVQPGKGFGKHSHKNMEIISYVLDGELAHSDSTGHASVIRHGDVQRMTAGTGVTHSEFNHSDKSLVHFLQIWITPGKMGLPPSYQEENFSPEDRRNRLKLIVSPGSQEGSLEIHQDTRIFCSELEAKKEVSYQLSSNRYGWIQVARGLLEVNGVVLRVGDGAAISGETDLKIVATVASEFLFFDLA